MYIHCIYTYIYTCILYIRENLRIKKECDNFNIFLYDPVQLPFQKVMIITHSFGLLLIKEDLD